MRKINVVPYLKDYKNQSDVLRDFNKGRDFLIADFFNPYDGKPVNKSEIIEAGYESIQFRYDDFKQVFIHRIGK
jgi:hypothetical protein